jgi:hypothetical protein
MAMASLLLAACGSSKSSSTTDKSTTAPTTPSATNVTQNTVASSTSTTTASKNLPNGEYSGKFSGVETSLKLANFTVNCPKTAAGTYLVNLVQGSFEVESNPAKPEAGHVDTVDFDTWAQGQAKQEWVVNQTDASVDVRSATAPSDHSVC